MDWIAVMGQWAAFLDRDGTVIKDVPLLSKPEELDVLPGSTAAVRRLREAGALVILVTNQPAVARGLIDENALGIIHERLKALFAADGARFDAIYYCPHHPETRHPEANDPRYRRECDCRKPRAGMLLEASRRFDIDLARSFMIGDTTRDLLTARNAGCSAVLVQTGQAGNDGSFDVRPDVVCKDVLAAAEWIVSRAKTA